MSNKVIRVGFVGAGSVNFGGRGDPWDHATRLESINSEGKFKLSVVGIYDINQQSAEKILKGRLDKSGNTDRNIWKNARIYTSLPVMLEEAKLDAVWIGVPPAAHGEIERLCSKAGVHMFIEKPIHCHEPSVVESISKNLITNRPDLVVSVGYMLRYAKAVEYIKNFLTEKNIQPTSIIARYNTAYPSILSPMYWDRKLSGGPVIEQATHFCDLLRYFGGEVDHTSISAIGVLPAEKPGMLNSVPKGVEDKLPEKRKIPRATHALFKFNSGAIGSLSHGVLQHGQKYHTQFEIWCDGYRILLEDPYSSACTVTINDKVTHFPDDDMYHTEDTAFLHAIVTGDRSKIKSLYPDAVSTYKLTWDITRDVRYKSARHAKL